MRPDSSFDPVVLSRYLTGDTTPDEQRSVEQWLVENPAEQRILDALRTGGTDPYGPIPAYNAEARVAATVDYSIRAARRSRREGSAVSLTRHSREGGNPATGSSLLAPDRRMLARTLWYTLGAAAAIMALLLTGWNVRDSRPAPSVYTYTTSNGERATVVLPDGSTVLLNVASRLEVPTNYDHGHRALRLVGEAMFTVTHHNGSPFTVTAGSSTTRVLGTSFTVRRYPTDTATIIAVRDGKVTVGSLVLTAGYETVVSATAMAVASRTTVKRFSFANGALMLNDLLLPDAIPELNRWYNAEIRLGDPALATQRVTGTFEEGSLTDVISILEIAFNVRIVREGRVLTLYPQG